MFKGRHEKFEDRLHRIEPWLMRGSQPSPKDYSELYDAGIRVIVNLRKHDETNDIEKVAPEILAVRIAVPNHNAPYDAQALKWLELCESVRAKLPIFVHCHAGHGRTSVFCALVRIAQGWPLEKIIAEERSYGFEPEEEVEQNEFIERFWSDVQSGRLQVPSLR